MMENEQGPDPMPINVYFSHRIRCDGEIAVIRVTQLEHEIVLTREQAESLADTIRSKYPKSGDIWLEKP